LSALGAHRVALKDPAQAAAMKVAADETASVLEMLAAGVERAASDPDEAAAKLSAHTTLAPLPAAEAAEPGEAAEATVHLVRTELGLVALQIDALREQARQWLQLKEAAPVLAITST